MQALGIYDSGGLVPTPAFYGVLQRFFLGLLTLSDE